MKRIPLFLFFLSVAVVLLAIYWPEQPRPVVDGGSFRVVAVHGNSGAAAVRDVINRGLQAVDSVRRPVVGEAAVALYKCRPESPLMNFAADALLEMAQRHSTAKVDVAITNYGGLRSELQQGVVTFGDVYNVFPFDNTLALLTLDGGQLWRLCSEVAAVGGEAISGMGMTMTPQGTLLSVMVAGEPLDTARRYRVATSDYLAQGNDKMTTLALGCEREFFPSITIRDLMVQYIKERSERGEAISAVCDGRITINENPL